MSLQIFILGMLCEDYHHPYDIKKMFKRIKLEEVLKISDGTLYYNFDVLLKKQYIEKIEIIRDEHRPDKTTYGITDKGREALQQEIYNSFKRFTDIKSLYAPLTFLKHADKDKISFLLEESIEKLRKKINKNHDGWNSLLQKPQETVQFIYEHALNRMELDAQWLEKLLTWIRSSST
ncbi:PadR family transcriptional regulator [Paenibacillus mendelii]|uniref:PadR family transcriptional regulator n=1 Tax=Paenibacillus mendelii TaxID=206163 RepID=A0ABV6JL30_9BACL|nr:PadR family transcriptional regulator [Paenibacillus mendelii]MCQ6562372.1 PadR family transcriptional regulator [Paenibacillus mendelii]